MEEHCRESRNSQASNKEYEIKDEAHHSVIGFLDGQNISKGYRYRPIKILIYYLGGLFPLLIFSRNLEILKDLRIFE